MDRIESSLGQRNGSKEVYYPRASAEAARRSEQEYILDDEKIF